VSGSSNTGTSGSSNTSASGGSSSSTGITIPTSYKKAQNYYITKLDKTHQYINVEYYEKNVLSRTFIIGYVTCNSKDNSTADYIDVDHYGENGFWYEDRFRALVVRESDIKFLNFANLRAILLTMVKTYDKEDCYAPWWIYDLSNWMESVIEPSVYLIKPTLGFMQASSPSILSQEVNYYKLPDDSERLIRYDGKLRPTFVLPYLNYAYTKQIIQKEDFDSSPYCELASSGYPYKYPSIGYCPYIRHNLIMNGDDVGCKEGKEPNIYNPCTIAFEYKWYTTSMILYLNKELVQSIHVTKSSEREETDLVPLIKAQLASTYSITDNDLLNYVYDKYTWTSDWEYEKLDNLYDYIYTVKLKLK